MSRPIRVLELRSVAGTGGGPDKTLLSSARVSDSDVSLTLCYLCNVGDESFQIGHTARQQGLDYIEIRERGPFDRSAWRAIRRLVQERHFDIVHGHEYKTDLLAYLLSKVEPIIPFATAHGWTGHSRMERLVYYPADKRLLTRFSHVVAVSGEIRDVLLRAGARSDRITVIPNGIDPVVFRRDAAIQSRLRDQFGVDSDSIVVGAVGRLEPQKRFDLLIKAFASVVAAFPSARLLIGGEGSLRSTLESCIEQAGLTGRAKLVGQVDVRQFHHTLNVFVQSSDYEGTPNVVLEAMALETPVVATDVGGTAELCADRVHGLLVPSGSPELLARAITETLGDPQSAAARVRAARSRVETELSFERRLERINERYRALVPGTTQSTS